MQAERLTVVNEVGLHARPAALFVNAASSFQASIQVRNATTSSEWVDGKSILGVLVLGVEKGHEIEVRVEGRDEVEARQALSDLVLSDFAGNSRGDPGRAKRHSEGAG